MNSTGAPMASPIASPKRDPKHRSKVASSEASYGVFVILVVFELNPVQKSLKVRNSCLIATDIFHVPNVKFKGFDGRLAVHLG